MPTTADLQQIETEYLDRHNEYKQIISTLPLASADVPDTDVSSCILAEGTFLRYFTLWENSIEKAFIYFCQGAPALNGHQPVCRLANCTDDKVRRILANGHRYLDWSDQRVIRERSTLFFDNGVPFFDAIGGKTQVLSDAERIRNVIAHDSVESWNSYRTVQRYNFQTERTFLMSPGQMLRARERQKTNNWAEYYLDAIKQTFSAILRP